MKRENGFTLVLTVEHADYERFGHITGFVARDSETAENGYKQLEYGHAFGSLAIGSQTSQGADGIYAWAVGMTAHGPQSGYELEQSLKVIRPIERRMAAMAEREGNPASFGQWCNRVARAVGAVSIVLRDPAYTHGNKQYRLKRFGLGDTFIIDRAAENLIAWSKGLAEAA